MTPPARVLFIDAYDSFSNNIIGLLRSSVYVSVEVIKIDDDRFVLNNEAFYAFLRTFDAVVAGPGPGHTGNEDDVGLIGKLWHQPDAHIVPVLGICLGFQSLALNFGASIERLSEPRHGLVSPINHSDTDIFADAGDLMATQYHSLHVRLGQDARTSEDRWTPHRECKQLVPLAWDVSSAVDGPILMGVRHCHKPLWGVQYHLESICSTGGPQLIRSWWQEVCRWNMMTRSPPDDRKERPSESDGAAPTSQVETRASRAVAWRAVQLSHAVDVAEIVELMRDGSGYDPILLESGTRKGVPVNSETGRYSIIALHDESSVQVRWNAEDRRLFVKVVGVSPQSRLASVANVFDIMDGLKQQWKSRDGPEVPFWGGFVGFISYEAGLETIDVSPATHSETRPDIWFIMVKRSVVVDHVAMVVYVQSIEEGDAAWVDCTHLRLSDLVKSTMSAPREQVKIAVCPGEMVAGPSEAGYCRKVSGCQSHLRAGSSYELCLTAQTTVRNSTSAWSLYRRLREANPAPFGVYFCLTGEGKASGVSLIGSSPERFLSWSRDGKCQFRPIKGTVKKTAGLTRQKADALLSSQKERAENLMIVDLIRHDLSGVTGVRDVQVSKLMSIEEYESVYQLVSVVEGSLKDTKASTSALAQSLPPGSMTGAPKKRSCELLHEIEEGVSRGLYSGVFGYMDVGGGGDFSVVIRSAFKWDDEENLWRIGAGGAVTALSEPRAEWEEMLVKRQAVLDVLLAASP